MLEFVWLQKVIMLCVWVVGTWKGLSNDQRWWWWRWRMLVSSTRSFVATKLQTKLQIDTVKSLAVTKPQWVGNQPTISALMMTAWLFTLPSAVNSTCSQNGKGDAELMSFPLLSPITHAYCSTFMSTTVLQQHPILLSLVSFAVHLYTSCWLSCHFHRRKHCRTPIRLLQRSLLPNVTTRDNTNNPIHVLLSTWFLSLS